MQPVHVACLILSSMAENAGEIFHQLLQPLATVLCLTTEALKIFVHSVSVVKAWVCTLGGAAGLANVKDALLSPLLTAPALLTVELASRGFIALCSCGYHDGL